MTKIQAMCKIINIRGDMNASKMRTKSVNMTWPI